MLTVRLLLRKSKTLALPGEGTKALIMAIATGKPMTAIGG